MSKKYENNNYKRNVKECISDTLYELKRKLSEKFFSKLNKDSAKTSFKKAEKIFVVCALVIPIVHWFIFTLYVNINSILLAFQNQRTGEWTINNFLGVWEQLSNPSGNNLGIALKNTLVYFVKDVFIVFPISIIIAFFLYKKILGYKTFRIVFYLPAIISSLVLITAYTRFIDPKGALGLIMQILDKEIPPEGYLARASTATNVIVIYSIWTGFTGNVLLFGGAMSRVPIEVLESAKLEGVGPWKEITSIIVPLIFPTLSTQFIFVLTGIFSSSGPILLFTKGAYETTTLSYWIFEQVYGGGTYGGSGSYNLVSAMGLCFTLIGVPLILFARYLLNRVEDVEY